MYVYVYIYIYIIYIYIYIYKYIYIYRCMSILQYEVRHGAWEAAADVMIL